MRVSDVMATKARTCTKDETLECAARLMWDHDIGCVVVVDDGGRAIAMLTDRDACMAAYTQGLPLHEILVATAMSRDLVACRPEDSILDAWSLMRGRLVRRLPVLGETGALVGVISLNDIARAQSKGRRRDLTAEEVTKTLSEISAPRVPLPVVSS